MSLNLYEMSGRVKYSEFVPAAAELVRAIATRAGRTLHSRYGVRVLPMAQNGGASLVDFGDRIDMYLPALHPDTEITAELANSLVGLILHECGHVLHTNSPAVSMQMFNAVKAGDPKRAELINAMEDYYIERRITNPVAPMSSNAAPLLGAVNAQLQANAPTIAAQARAAGDVVGQAYALTLASLDRHGRQGGAISKIEQATRAAVDPQITALVDQALDRLDRIDDGRPPRQSGIHDTGRRLQSTEQLLTALGSIKPQAQPQPEEGEGEEKGPKQKGKGQGEGGGQGKPEDKPDQDADQDADQGDQGDQGDNQGDDQGDGEGEGDEGDGTPGGLAAGKGNAAMGNTAYDRKKSLLASMTPMQTDAQTQLGSAMLLALGMPPSFAGGKSLWIPNPHANHPVRIAAAHANARTFADAARRALKSEDTTVVSRRLQVGRLDRRAITRASLGSADVMSRKRVDQGITTAVMVMLDMSGSMADGVSVGGRRMSRIAACLGMASVIVPAIERAGAAVALGGFTDDPFMLKPWHERTPTTDAMLHTYGDLKFGGSTSMTGPLLWAEKEIMAQRHVSRRVVVWLLDGQLAGADEISARYLTKRASKVEHYGIGLQCDVSSLFAKDRAVALQGMSGLARAFERLIIPKGGRL